MASGKTGDLGEFPAIDHIAVAVPDLEAAASLYRDQFGAAISDPVTNAEQSIRMVYAQFANVRIELMQPLDEDSPVGRFLVRNPHGGLHHICLVTADVDAAYGASVAGGLRPVQPPREGHHGRPLFFLHPKATHGALIEIEQEENRRAGQAHAAWRSS